MGSGITTLAWYNYGKQSFLKNGYQASEARLKAVFEGSSEKKVVAITGANSGIGKAMTKQLTERGHKVFMICRSQQRAEDARKDILDQISSESIQTPKIVIADCTDPESLVKGVKDFDTSHLDALVINAGALLDNYTTNASGTHEFNCSVFVVHGFHLLTKLCLPYLRQSEDPRVICVSSGGMYRVALDMKKLSESSPSTYDAVEAYCQGKRAQVIMTEQFAEKEKGISFYSCHPGWALTGSVEATSKLKGLLQWTGAENWRSPEEAALGISVLAQEKSSNLQNGEFYLDGEVAPKHLPGSWYSWMGSSTKCSEKMKNTLWEYCEEANSNFV